MPTDLQRRNPGRVDLRTAVDLSKLTNLEDAEGRPIIGRDHIDTVDSRVAGVRCEERAGRSIHRIVHTMIGHQRPGLIEERIGNRRLDCAIGLEHLDIVCREVRYPV